MFPRSALAVPFLALAITACGGGTRMVETGVRPTQAAALQPRRDAAGQIVGGETVAISDATAFTAITAQTLTSRTAAVGDPVQLVAADNIRVNDVVVITAGTPVRAVVSAVERAGRMGKSGSLSLRVESTTAVDGQTVRLRATRMAEADGRTGNTVALAIVVSPLFLLRKGQDIEYPMGTPITVYTDGRITVAGWRP